jgi:hypothetical protein
MAADYSESEKADLFASIAIRAYRLPEVLGQPSIVAEQFASKRFGQTDINSRSSVDDGRGSARFVDHPVRSCSSSRRVW